MRLSDAINLGITRWKLAPDNWICKDGGCLLGIGAMAAGVKFGEKEDLSLIIARWPWIRNEVIPPTNMCNCKGNHLFNHLHEWTGDVPVYSIISCMAFCLRNGTITVEQVVDWVRSVEPQEEVAPVIESLPEAVCA